MTKTMTANVPVAMRDPNATCNRFVGDHERCGRPGIVAYNVEGARGQQASHQNALQVCHQNSSHAASHGERC